MPKCCDKTKRTSLRNEGIVVVLFVALLAISAQAQTFTVLHSFSGRDGQNPVGSLIFDRANNLLGTTASGGPGYCDFDELSGCGTVFKLSRQGSSWILDILYNFHGGSDAATPLGSVAIARDGTVYGTTQYGGTGAGCSEYGCGTVFRLQPWPNLCYAAQCGWTERLPYQFFQGDDQIYFPRAGVTFDSAGNIYGTTTIGGTNCNLIGVGCGVVYELTPTQGGWTFQVLYTFQGGADGGDAASGLTIDNQGNLYGTTRDGGDGNDQGSGTVYRLRRSQSGWTKDILYTFQGATDGANPLAGVIFDSAGNLYGGTTAGGIGSGGTVFELTPSGGGWTFHLLHSFVGNGYGVYGNLALDSAGNVYGTTAQGGAHNEGSLFKMTRSSGSWTFTSLHDFSGSEDGGEVYAGVTLDSAGNLYGATDIGGAFGYGAVYELTQ